jgi:hypothetical protein
MGQLNQPVQIMVKQAVADKVVASGQTNLIAIAGLPNRRAFFVHR